MIVGIIGEIVDPHLDVDTVPPAADGILLQLVLIVETIDPDPFDEELLLVGEVPDRLMNSVRTNTRLSNCINVMHDGPDDSLQATSRPLLGDEDAPLAEVSIQSSHFEIRQEAIDHASHPQANLAVDRRAAEP